MKRITTNIALWLMGIGISSFWIVYFALGQSTTVEIASGLILGACIVLMLSWLPAMAIGVMKGTRGDSDVLALGIFSVGLFGSIRQEWTLIYRWLDRPEWMLMHWSYPLILWAVFWGLLTVIIAPGTVNGEIPTSNKIYLFGASIIGALVSGIAIGMSLVQPNI
jgi:hypothetical protein